MWCPRCRHFTFFLNGINGCNNCGWQRSIPKMTYCNSDHDHDLYKCVPHPLWREFLESQVKEKPKVLDLTVSAKHALNGTMDEYHFRLDCGGNFVALGNGLFDLAACKALSVFFAIACDELARRKED